MKQELIQEQKQKRTRKKKVSPMSELIQVMVTPEQQELLAQWAQDECEGNISQFIRKILFHR